MAERGIAERGCPLCGHPNLELLGARFALTCLDADRTEMGPIAVVPLFCRNCGFVANLVADYVGV